MDVAVLTALQSESFQCLMLSLSNTLQKYSTVSQQVEYFCGQSLTTSEQHTDARDSRILRDNEDVQKLLGWFEYHDPFPVSDFVMPINTGILGLVWFDKVYWRKKFFLYAAPNMWCRRKS
ncbi:hypothetical protein AVEN_29965-1 [Araneus ventricosus]|uniref:Uncharacterized protein n=1 Tax=Araneus ventricosus TaxID=182803 RepID=A0A4Y2Q0W6_ARAVE|nr:hypothetical protein AVEN_29965-1 [Araneus ventricosus]